MYTPSASNDKIKPIVHAESSSVTRLLHHRSERASTYRVETRSRPRLRPDARRAGDGRRRSRSAAAATPKRYRQPAIFLGAANGTRSRRRGNVLGTRHSPAAETE